MKKTLTLVLAAVMLVTVCAAFSVSADAESFVANSWNPASADLTGQEGVIYTTTNGNNGWWHTVAFAPNGENWEVVATTTPDGTVLDIPEGGFVWALHDTGPHNWEFIDSLQAGEVYVITGLDIANQTCADDATIALYDGSSEPSEPSEPVEYPEWSNFFLSHYNDGNVEGAGVIFTETDAAGDWWIHAAFAPVEGFSNVFTIVELKAGDGTSGSLAIPEGGFVYGINTGNNWPELFEQTGATGDGSSGQWFDDPEHAAMPDYTSPNASAMWEAAGAWAVGETYVFDGLDLANLTVPTSTPDVEWYEDDYVCTAKYKAYVEGDPDALPATEDDNSDESNTPDAGDASSMIVFAVIALVALAGSAVVVKTRR